MVPPELPVRQAEAADGVPVRPGGCREARVHPLPGDILSIVYRGNVPSVKIFVFIDKNLTAQGEKDIVESTEVYPLPKKGLLHNRRKQGRVSAPCMIFCCLR